MSVDTNVIYACANPKKKLEHLYKTICDEMPKSIKLVCDSYYDRWSIKSWSFTNNKLSGAGGFTFTAYDKLIVGYHMMPFYYFVSQTSEGICLLNAFNNIARILHVRQFIICPELTPFHKKDINSIDDIAENLRQTIGLEAKNWQELSQSEHFGANSWMLIDVIDTDVIL